MSSVSQWESEYEGTAVSSGGGNGGQTGGGDCAQRVFGLAPFFCYAHLWHMERHCNNTNSAGSNICFSCPLTSDEMLKLYRERQLKGSNLIVGLSAEAASRHGGQDIPPSFLRTLAYLFEVVKKGLGYPPLTKADIMAGAPSPSWGPPLWPTEPCSPLTSLSDPLMLFQLAPYWCYLYNHEPQRSKKTPPKTAAQMANMYMSGSLPLWTPVLGLEAEVARFNSLPPCLFMTLGSIVSLLASGQAVKAIGLRELQCYDKFIGYRSASGSTNALPLVAQDSEGTQTSLGTANSHCLPAPSTSPSCGVGGPSSTHLSGNLNHHLAPAHNSGQQAFPPSSTSWNYSRMQGGTSNGGEASPSYLIPSSPGTSSIPRTSSDASGTWGHSASHAYQQALPSSGGSGLAMPPPQLQHHQHHRRGPSGSNSTSVACIPAFPPAPLTPLSPISSPASSSKALSTSAAVPPAHPPPIPWQTALFKLFTSDASRGRFQPLWWYLDLCAPAGMHGPISAEHMIIGYLQGTLGDSSMVCGVTSECTANHRPAYDSFEPIGVLLEKINLGGHYMLVTLNEMLGLPPPPSPHPPPYQPSPFLPTYSNPAPVAPLPTYQTPAAPAPLPTYSTSPLPTYSGAAPPPSGPPLPLYSPPSAGLVGMVPESSRMVVQQQQQPRSSLGAGLVGAPPPHGLPPTHHHLSPRNLHGLRTGHHRHQKSNSASRTSLASSIDAAPPTLAAPMQQQQPPLPVMDAQQPATQATNQQQPQHDSYSHLQQQGSITPPGAPVLRSRSSLDSGCSGFQGVEGDVRSSPPLSPPSEAMQPALSAAATTAAAAAAVAASAHPDAVPPAEGVLAASNEEQSQAQAQQLPTLPTPQPSTPPPQQHQQQQQQEEHVGVKKEMGEQQQYPLQNGHESSLASATAKISLSGQKSAVKSKVDSSRESESADEHNHVVHNMRSALSCSGDLERPILSLST